MTTRKTLIFSILAASLILTAITLTVPRASAQPTYQPVQVLRIQPYRCLPLGDRSGIFQEIHVPSASMVILVNPWYMEGPQYARDYVTNTALRPTLGEAPIDNPRDYWAGEPTWAEDVMGIGAAWAQYWIYPAIGPLPDGRSLTVHWEMEMLKAVSDGDSTAPAGTVYINDCTIVWGE